MKQLIIFLIIINNLFGFEKITSFEANFKQIITNKNKKIIKYSGKVFFKIKKEPKILWIYEKPILKKVYIIGKKVTIIEPELEQVIIAKLDSNYNLAKILKNAKKINNNLYEAKLQNIIYKIKLNNNKIKTISFKDNLDNKNEIIFENAKQNLKLDNKLFTFNIPYDYDVINK